jgi:hypothetical protein
LFEGASVWLLSVETFSDGVGEEFDTGLADYLIPATYR